MSKKQLYALIKWVEDSTYTPGVPIEWIKYFDYNNFVSGDYDINRCVPIEWRDTLKEPYGGWPCYDGLIIDVSDKISKLKKKMKMIEGVRSPRRITSDIAHQTIDRKRKNKREREIDEIDDKIEENLIKTPCLNYFDENVITKKKDKKSALTERYTEKKSIKELMSSTPMAENVKNAEEITSVQQKVVFKNKQRRLIYEISSESEKEDFCIDSPSTSTFTGTKEISLQTILEVNLKTQAMVKELFSLIKNTEKTFSKSDQSTSSEKEMVEIQPGSGVEVTSRDWKLAVSRTTFTAMGLTLLTTLFPHDILLSSNLKGGSSKIKRNDRNKTVFTALNPRILNALMYAVEKQHSSTFKESLLGAAINNKLNVIRKNAQRATLINNEEEEDDI